MYCVEKKINLTSILQTTIGRFTPFPNCFPDVFGLFIWFCFSLSNSMEQ